MSRDTSTSPEISPQNSSVQCNGGPILPVRLNTNVPWQIAKLKFLGGSLAGHCTFFNKNTGAVIVKGSIVISSGLQTGTVSVEPSQGYTAEIRGNNSANVTVVLGKVS